MSVAAPVHGNRPPEGGSNEYETPQAFFNRLQTEFLFDIDAFATERNAKCRHFFTADLSALDHPWLMRSFGRPDRRMVRVFANPPYPQNMLGKCVWRASQQSTDHGVLVVMLIPPSTGATWWHNVVMRRASEVRFVNGRLGFEYNGQPIVVTDENGKLRPGSNRGDSCVVVFRPGVHGPVFSSMDATLSTDKEVSK